MKSKLYWPSTFSLVLYLYSWRKVVLTYIKTSRCAMKRCDLCRKMKVWKEAENKGFVCMDVITWRLLLERSNLQMVAKLREGLGRESKDMALKSTISSLSSSMGFLLSVFFLKSTLTDMGCWKRCCCSYIIL